MDHRELLKQYYGYDEYRPGQEELITAVLNGRDALGIMPTGAGKSLCFQIPALMLDGLTLVISPLVSLMLDQVMTLVRQGIHAAFLNSTLTPVAQQVVMNRAASGEFDIMYVTPERLSSPLFRHFAQCRRIPMVTVDEAHCISQWGHNFRPDYLQITPFIESLPTRPIVSAFTATAANPVREDILRSLKLRDPFIRVNGFDRPNLFFDVIRDGDKDKETRKFLRRQGNRGGIIYCNTRKAVDELSASLQEEGYPVTRYHAGLSDAERKRNQDDFLYDRKPVMVATNAFGMGIDKSNVSFVLHYNMPKNLESYYQEAGRAGRDGSPAECMLLYNKRDYRTNEFLIDKSLDENLELEPTDRETMRAHEKDLLKQMTFYSTSTSCYRGFILNYFGDQVMGQCGHCGNCLAKFDTVDLTEEILKIVHCVLELEMMERSYGQTILSVILKGNANETITRYGYDRLRSFGAFRSLPTARIRELIQLALSEGYLTSSGGEYPTLSISPLGRELLGGDRRVTTLVERVETEEKTAKKEKLLTFSDEIDPAFYESLRALRKEIADEEDVPAYIIFTNETLREIARARPLTRAAFRNIKGVGQRKTDRYADPFIQMIRRFTRERG